MQLVMQKTPSRRTESGDGDEESWCDCRLVTGRGDGGDGCDGCVEAVIDGEESERTVVCRLWSLMLIRRKRVGVQQCGGDGEGGRAGAGESSRAMAAMAMMAVMAGDSERRAAAKEERRQQASSVSPWAKGGKAAEEGGGTRSGAAGEAREIPQRKFPRISELF